jgi:ATP-dependent exoDNAse (exonuclease V) alpha subunit
VLAAANAQRAKVVLVGDDRQLGPVGPGGALGALLRRHHGNVHLLNDNVRQTDPGERRALAELRAGDVDRAVAWYHQAGRIRPAPDQDQAVAAVVEAWAGDVAVGADSVILAWRRASVDRLNQHARAAWSAMGNLSGPELQAPGGRRYAAGDLIVALAPTGDPAVLTSQRGRVVHVEQQTSAMIVRLDDGRDVRLAGEQLAADRLAHSYALTVHRAQGPHSRYLSPSGRRRRPRAGLCGHEPGPDIHHRARYGRRR